MTLQNALGNLALDATVASAVAKMAGDTTNGSIVQNRPDSITTGTITSATPSTTDRVILAIPAGCRAVGLQFSGTYSGITAALECDFNNNGVFSAFTMSTIGSSLAATTTGVVLSTNATTTFTGAVAAGMTNIRVRATAYSSGTLNIVLAASSTSAVVSLSSLVSVSNGILATAGVTSIAKIEDGGSASGDVGVFVLGVRNDALASPTDTNGDYIQHSMDARGAQFVNASTYQLTNIATSTMTNLKSGAGFLRGLTINAAGTVASTITIYDSLTAAGTKLATINSLSPLGNNFVYEGVFSTGLTIVTTGTVAPDITVAWR